MHVITSINCVGINSSLTKKTSDVDKYRLIDIDIEMSDIDTWVRYRKFLISKMTEPPPPTDDQLERQVGKKSACWEYLCIPATSVPSEQLFSHAGDTITKKRNRLKADNVELLVFVGDNYKHYYEV